MEPVKSVANQVRQVQFEKTLPGAIIR